MKISLWQLNQSFNALARLAAREIPKEHHKLAWVLSRILRSARMEIELLTDSLNDLMRKSGFEPGQRDVDEEAAREYSENATAFMKANDCELWGDPIAFDKIAGVLPVIPADLVLLDWLFIEDEATNGGQTDAVV